MRSFFKAILIIFLIFLGFSILGGIYRLLSSDDSSLHEANIGVIEINGVITTAFPVMEQIDELKKNSNLKALVVRVDSPGGAVGAAQEIYMELKKLREKMPVVISMGDLAASGGLYVSLGGSQIFALPGTLTGSMGVLLQLTGVNRLLEKIYVDPITLKSGELKDTGNPTVPLSAHGKKYLQDLIMTNFEGFKKAVKEERKLSDESIKFLSDGRVVDGNTALEMKLVDQIGTFRDAVDAAKEKAKISSEPKLAFLSRKPKSFVEKIVQEMASPIRDLVKNQATTFEYRWDPGAGAIR